MRIYKGLTKVWWKDESELLDADLAEVLGNLKSSIHGWSEAAYSRPRSVVAVSHRSWRLAASWALGCALVAASLTTGLHERHIRQEQARIAATEQAQKQELAAQQRSQEQDANLMATVDTDVSREVPSAMEPLAQLMEEGANQ
jgi:hypothetical protein